ncbi:IclR family transcriptional regulator [Spirillospora sp. CA-142024]|uniref:IclR family transcriptional regulator n=1 Tax=Spirillospora sp. CA-142024 TaxID=3240036 RepID=UPI003D8E32AF
MSTPKRDDRAAVDKAVSLLLSFGDQAGAGIGVSELARRARMSKSTAFRLLGVLERNGVVEKVGPKYRLGERLHELGSRVYVPDHARIRDALIPFLTDLYELTHETVHLAALHGTDVVYLAKLHGHRPARSPSRIGGRVPAYCTAVGKVLLAYDHEALEQVLRADLRPLTTNTVTDPERLVREIAGIRREGVAFDHEESTPGLSCVAVPVLGPGGRAVAAMSVAALTGRLDIRAQAPALRRMSAAAAGHLMRARRAA